MGTSQPGACVALTPAVASCSQGCHAALEHALITAPEVRDPDLLKKLDAIAGRVLGKFK